MTRMALAALLLIGCGDTITNVYEAPPAKGGTSAIVEATGGATAAALPATGGTSSTGGAQATGGKAATGGMLGTGGHQPCLTPDGVDCYQFGPSGTKICQNGKCVDCPKDSLSCDYNDANGCETKRDFSRCESCQFGCQTGWSCIPNSGGDWGCVLLYP
jgi:hypothetical protein